jgi:hypothetical protein
MADGVFLIGHDEMAKCHVCHRFFDPQVDSHNGEYLERCEARTKSGGPFPSDLPRFSESNPYAFCSADCEQDAVDSVCVNRIEDERLMQDDTPSLPYLGSYAL